MLRTRLSPIMGRPLDAIEIRRLGELLADHRRDCRSQLGVDFPVLAAFVFPRLGQIDLVRADMPQTEIEKTIVNFTVKYPDVTAQEVAFAVTTAFPDYKMRRFRQ